MMTTALVGLAARFMVLTKSVAPAAATTMKTTCRHADVKRTTRLHEPMMTTTKPLSRSQLSGRGPNTRKHGFSTAVLETIF